MLDPPPCELICPKVTHCRDLLQCTTCNYAQGRIDVHQHEFLWDLKALAASRNSNVYGLEGECCLLETLIQVQKRIVSLIRASKVMTKCSDNLRFKPYHFAIMYVTQFLRCMGHLCVTLSSCSYSIALRPTSTEAYQSRL